MRAAHRVQLNQKVLEEPLQATDAITSSEARLTEQKDVSGKVNDHKDVTDIVSNK